MYVFFRDMFVYLYTYKYTCIYNKYTYIYTCVYNKTYIRVFTWRTLAERNAVLPVISSYIHMCAACLEGSSSGENGVALCCGVKTYRQRCEPQQLMYANPRTTYTYVRIHTRHTHTPHTSMATAERKAVLPIFTPTQKHTHTHLYVLAAHLDGNGDEKGCVANLYTHKKYTHTYLYICATHLDGGGREEGGVASEELSARNHYHSQSRRQSKETQQQFLYPCQKVYCQHLDAMGWLRLVGSLKVYVSFTEYSLFYRGFWTRDL